MTYTQARPRRTRRSVRNGATCIRIAQLGLTTLGFYGLAYSLTDSLDVLQRYADRIS